MSFRAAVGIIVVFTLLSGPSFAQSGSPPKSAVSFSSWLQELKSQALAEGISRETVERALAGVEPIPRVIELDRRQPELTLTLEDYLARTVTANRIETGKRKLREHGALLSEISKKYGVPPRLIVALWGLETNFGRNQGSFSVIGSLVTLAYEGRRGAFFRKALLHALAIVDKGHVRLEDFKGSWAGAMGQSQFMPSSFIAYGVDHDGDKRIDIWNTLPDVFASIANYLSRTGWKKDLSWGNEVRLPDSLDAEQIDLKKPLPSKRWIALGLLPAAGDRLPEDERAVSLLLPEGRKGRAFLVTSNFETILRWNRSNLFALAVGILSDAIEPAEGNIALPSGNDESGKPDTGPSK
jgi:membrane-bound lytic murein transglycosylase B